MLSQELRKKFLTYFQKNGHTLVPSSPVVPHEDPTLLFVNAGMNQFKDVFLGRSVRDYVSAASAQKCIRVGGKHNDLENVGHTRRHLTFFEMLGNFSFGDYFKEDAIRFAWVVSVEIFALDPEKIWPTVFETDDESFALWEKYVPTSRITRMGEKDNFWAMGEVGPCGPCSELLYDRGEAFGSAPNPLKDQEGERYLEFWNLVFMQFNRQADGTLQALPKPSIDTGAGLERIVDLKMGSETVYDTDILRALITRVERISQIPYDPHDEKRAPAFRVIADHLRCLAFAIGDGAQPSNLDRGYVLRKVLRRAVRYGRRLGLNRPFLGELIPTLIECMGRDYPELSLAEDRIVEICTREEEAFSRTLQRGGNLLSKIVSHAHQQREKKIVGEEAFKLKDTYGFPLEEILLLAKDDGLQVDVDRFYQLEQEAKKLSQKGQKKREQEHLDSLFAPFIEEHPPCQFVGYDKVQASGEITRIVQESSFVSSLSEGEEGIVLLTNTPFYAEKGGQVGDTGSLQSAAGTATVTDCQSPYPGIIAHHVTCTKGSLTVGEEVVALIDVKKREEIARNHTATHLLHWALCQVLGEHVRQAGSVVDSHRLRFDFSHHKALSLEEIEKIENLVNEKIRTNSPVIWHEIPYEEAQKSREIKQFFGDKYGKHVRVVDIGFSKELCGGTHTSSVGNIGVFAITRESSIAAGVRRIEGTTGQNALSHFRHPSHFVRTLSDQLKTSPQKLQSRIDKLLDENRQLASHIKELEERERGQLILSLKEKRETIHSFETLIAQVPLSPRHIKELGQALLQEIGPSVIFLGCTAGEKAQLAAFVADSLIEKGLNARELIQQTAPLIGGKGGGKAQFAQAGGTHPEKLPDALELARKIIQQVSSS